MPRFDLSSIEYLRSSPPVECEVGGRLKKFYPLSPLNITLFQQHAQTFAQHLRDAAYKYSDEAGQNTSTTRDERLQTMAQDVTIMPLSAEASKLHRAARMESASKLASAALDPALMRLLGLCILDSMRDDFPRDPQKPWTEVDGRDLVAALTIPAFFQCCKGVLQANLDSFGPFAKKAVAKAAAKLEKLVDQVEEPVEEPVEETSPSPGPRLSEESSSS